MNYEFKFKYYLISSDDHQNNSNYSIHYPDTRRYSMAAINNNTINNRARGGDQDNNSDDDDSVTGNKETKIDMPITSPPQYSTLSSAEKFADKKVKVCKKKYSEAFSLKRRKSVECFLRPFFILCYQ